MVPRLTELTQRRHEHRNEGAVEEHRFILDALDDLPVFADHFPGSPILPAFVGLAAAIERAHRAWPDLGPWAGAPAMKFQAPIRPGSRLVLELRRDASSSRVAFAISCEETRCASGTLSFAPGETSTA